MNGLTTAKKKHPSIGLFARITCVEIKLDIRVWRMDFGFLLVRTSSRSCKLRVRGIDPCKVGTIVNITLPNSKRVVFVDLQP